MKQQFNFYVLPAFLMLVFFPPGCSTGKKVTVTASEEAIAGAVSSDRWVFTAYNVNPQSGRTRPVNGSYEVKFSRDTVVVYLPYFGRLYSGAGVMDNRGPLDFTTTAFNFSKEKGKRDEWIVTIKPQDYGEVQSMVFSLFDSGTARLNVTLTNRSPISFTGIVAPRQ